MTIMGAEAAVGRHGAPTVVWRAIIDIEHRLVLVEEETQVRRARNGFGKGLRA